MCFFFFFFLLSFIIYFQGYFYGGYTPLMYAVLFGHKDGVKFLLDSGADRNLKSEVGENDIIKKCTLIAINIIS